MAADEMKMGETLRIWDAAKWLWRESAGFRARIFALALCGILRVAVSITFVWTSKRLIDIATHRAAGEFDVWMGYMFVCIVLQLAFSSLSSRIYVGTSMAMSNGLRQKLMDHVLRSRWTGREKFHSGDVLNRIEEDVNTVTGMLCSSMPSMLITLAQFCGASIYLAILDARLALVVIAIMPIALLLSKLYMRRMRRLTRAIRSTDSKVQSHMQENLQHRVLVNTLERTVMVTDTMVSLQQELTSLVLKRNAFSIFSGFVVQAAFALGYVVAFTWGVYGLAMGTVTFGMLTAFLQLVAQIQRPIVELSRQIPAFVNSMTAVERLDELFGLPLEEQGEKIIVPGTPGVRIIDLTFAYPDDDKIVFRHFSHDFTPGSLTAVVGETGVGKSTMVRLMLGLLRPTSGKIELYSGDFTVEASPLTRGNFVYVPQGNSLVSGTIRHNLRLGDPQADDEQMLRALHTACADFVLEMPQGLDTPCGEMGTGLSEGQAQRVAIARALLRPGKIVLFDEPTSSLDDETEHELLRRLQADVREKTLIIITHQRQTASLCAHRVRITRAAQ